MRREDRESQANRIRACARELSVEVPEELSGLVFEVYIGLLCRAIREYGGLGKQYRHVLDFLLDNMICDGERVAAVLDMWYDSDHEYDPNWHMVDYLSRAMRFNDTSSRWLAEAARGIGDVVTKPIQHRRLEIVGSETGKQWAKEKLEEAIQIIHGRKGEVGWL